jgi:hypothetical protein
MGPIPGGEIAVMQPQWLQYFSKRALNSPFIEKNIPNQAIIPGLSEARCSNRVPMRDLTFRD